MKTYIVDGYETCSNCGYELRPGWKINDETGDGIFCGKCCPELGLEPNARAINEYD